MPVNTTDVLTQEEIRMRLEEVTQRDLSFRQAFRSLDLTDINSDTYKIPRRKDVLGMPEEIPEGSEFPMDEEAWEMLTIHFSKYGFTVPISREAQQDSFRNVAADHVDAMGRQMRVLLDTIAYRTIEANHSSDSPAGGKGTKGEFGYHDVVDGLTEMRKDTYNPNLLIVNTQAQGDLLTSQEFIHASDLGDQTLTEGAIGQVAGMDVVVSNSQHMSTSTGEGYMFDTSFYGYEADREPISMNEYYEDSRQVDALQIWVQKGFKAMDPEACLKIEG